MVRALAEEVRTKEYLDNLESKLPEDKLHAWRLEEAKWKENIEHVEVDGDDFESPYELRSHRGTSVHTLSLVDPTLTALQVSLRRIFSQDWSSKQSRRVRRPSLC